MRRLFNLVMMCPVLAAAPLAAQKGDKLETGKYLKTNQYIASSGTFALMQNDGNFCLYRGESPSKHQGAVWCSKAAPGPGDYFAINQADGNFCVYKGTGPGDNRGYVWCSGTNGKGAVTVWVYNGSLKIGTPVGARVFPLGGVAVIPEKVLWQQP